MGAWGGGAIRANTLANRAEDAALARVEEIVERLDATRVERIALSPDSVPDPTTHARLVARLEAEADERGRRELLDDVRQQVRATLVQRFSPLSVRVGAGLPSPAGPTLRAEDEAMIVLAVMDTVSVAVMEDRLDPETARQLADPGRRLLGLPPIAAPSDAVLGAGASGALSEPSAADWAEAAAGETRIDGTYTPMPVTVRIVLATVAACTIGPGAVFVGVAGGSTLLGLAAGLAVVALCWVFATYGR